MVQYAYRKTTKTLNNMNTSEHYKLYIDDRGDIILGHREGYYNMSDAPAAAEALADFISRKAADVLFNDYGYGFHPAYFIGRIDLANMAPADIVAPIYAAYDKIVNSRRRLPAWLDVVAYDFAFYTQAAMCGEGYELRQVQGCYLPYLVNGDATGLEGSELVTAESLDEEMEVVAYEYEPSGYGEYTCLCRLKG